LNEKFNPMKNPRQNNALLPPAGRATPARDASWDSLKERQGKE
jgi:hypothetical protein